MAWRITEDLDEYLTAAWGFLRADPAARTVELGVLEDLRVHGLGLYGADPPLFGWWLDGTGRVGGTLLRTRPYPLLLSDVPPAAAGELAALLAGQRPLRAVNAEPSTARAFAEVWERHTGTVSKETLHQRLYRLDHLTTPNPLPPGAPRLATASDRDLVIAWHRAFKDEVHGPSTEHVPTQQIEGKITSGRVVLWETDGTPVSMAARTAIASDMARIAPVYTPPEYRRHGYGAAVTAALTQQTPKAGARHVVLFTDLANPTSNAIYQRLGYRPTSDRLVLSFHTR